MGIHLCSAFFAICRLFALDGYGMDAAATDHLRVLAIWTIGDRNGLWLILVRPAKYF
jgi:hypothetical protein